jgi:hypothetical protein
VLSSSFRICDKDKLLQIINWLTGGQQINDAKPQKMIIILLPQNKKKPHRNAAIVKNQSGSVTPKENEFI